MANPRSKEEKKEEKIAGLDTLKENLLVISNPDLRGHPNYLKLIKTPLLQAVDTSLKNLTDEKKGLLSDEVVKGKMGALPEDKYEPKFSQDVAAARDKFVADVKTQIGQLFEKPSILNEERWNSLFEKHTNEIVKLINDEKSIQSAPKEAWLNEIKAELKKLQSGAIFEDMQKLAFKGDNPIEEDMILGGSNKPDPSKFPHKDLLTLDDHVMKILLAPVKGSLEVKARDGTFSDTYEDAEPYKLKIKGIYTKKNSGTRKPFMVTISDETGQKVVSIPNVNDLGRWLSGPQLIEHLKTMLNVYMAHSKSATGEIKFGKEVDLDSILPFGDAVRANEGKPKLTLSEETIQHLLNRKTAFIKNKYSRNEIADACVALKGIDIRDKDSEEYKKAFQEERGRVEQIAIQMHAKEKKDDKKSAADYQANPKASIPGRG